VSPFHVLLLLFLAVPLAEIYLLIRVGGVIGAGPTVVLVVLTAVSGAFLMRMQGWRTLERVRAAMARGEVPAVELVEGALLLIAGALLLTPGFVTDSVGFALLVPPVRTALARAALARAISAPPPGARRPPGGSPGRVIEGDFERKDE
jgi:UPF0716 protein FxsA